jgi:hypothetical protein
MRRVCVVCKCVLWMMIRLCPCLIELLHVLLLPKRVLPSPEHF